MAALTIQQRTLIVQLYFQNYNSVTLTQIAFRRISGLWGYLKERVYINKPKTFEDLKQIIRQGIDTISREVLSSVKNAVTKRAQLVIVAGGRYLKKCYVSHVTFIKLTDLNFKIIKYRLFTCIFNRFITF